MDAFVFRSENTPLCAFRDSCPLDSNSGDDYSVPKGFSICRNLARALHNLDQLCRHPQHRNMAAELNYVKPPKTVILSPHKAVCVVSLIVEEGFALIDHVFLYC